MRRESPRIKRAVVNAGVHVYWAYAERTGAWGVVLDVRDYRTSPAGTPEGDSASFVSVSPAGEEWMGNFLSPSQTRMLIAALTHELEEAKKVASRQRRN